MNKKMRSLSSVGLGLTVIFGCLLLALLAELYYLLWWKKRFSNKDFLYMFCLKRPSHTTNNNNSRTLSNHNHNHHLHKDFVLKSFGDDGVGLQSLSGQTRFLFPIIEETKEDLESEHENGDNNKGGSKSLSDFLHNVETPYLTPLTSPTFTPQLNTCCYTKQGFNPLFEEASRDDAVFYKMKSLSPPPKFKFLQDAEEKLYRRNLMEEADRIRNLKSFQDLKLRKGDEEGGGSCITLMIDSNKEEQFY